MLWCLGMYASGSTWLFNAAMMIGAAVAPARPVVGRYIDSADALGLLGDQAGLVVIKTHDVEEAAVRILSGRADSILVSIRDPRDSVTSLMIYQRYGLVPALETTERSARACARFAADPRAVLLRYEAGFIDEAATLDRIAKSLGGTLSVADRTRIFAATRREAIEAHIAKLPELPTALHDAASGDIVDTATQWHTHHANRSGEIGRWRHLLTLADVAIIEQRLEDWMAAFGYQAEVAPYTRPIGGTPLGI
jgi:hypothetical protein